MFFCFGTLLITLSIFVSAVWAGDVEDGNAAHAKMDYGTAR
jgi:hypothetical protein